MKKVWIVWSAVLFSLFLITGCGSLSQGSGESIDPAAPIVTGVSPTEAKVGEQIRVTGERFGTSQGSSRLIVGGAAATQIVSWSDTEFHAVVPEGASSGSVKVVIAGAESSRGFLAVLWSQENPENVAISAAAGDQQSPQGVSDGSGGTSFDLYAQRVNGSGAVQWTSDGVPISTAAGSQQHPQLISDGASGAIITWQDGRDGNLDIYAHRISRDGVAQWTVDGIAAAVGGHSEFSPQIVPDGAGGATLAWQDDRSGKIDIYAQRVHAHGAVQWAAGGVAVSTAATNKFFFRLIPDGAGGAVLVWQDDRGGDWDLYAQRINRNGAVRWSADGVAVSIAANTQGAPQLVSDGTGGAIIVWQDNRDGAWDVYAQRVNGSGTAAWTPDGMIISNAANDQLVPQLVSDGAGGDHDLAGWLRPNRFRCPRPAGRRKRGGTLGRRRGGRRLGRFSQWNRRGPELGHLRPGNHRRRKGVRATFLLIFWSGAFVSPSAFHTICRPHLSTCAHHSNFTSFIPNRTSSPVTVPCRRRQWLDADFLIAVSKSPLQKVVGEESRFLDWIGFRNGARLIEES